MTFRSIQDLAISVLANIQIEASNRGSDMRAPARSATDKGLATSTRGEEPMPVAFAQSGEGTAEQTENGLPVYIAPRTGKRASKAADPESGGGHTAARELDEKMAEPGEPAKLTREDRLRLSQDKWLAIRQSLHTMRRCMGRETAARAPRAAGPFICALSMVMPSPSHMRGLD